MAFRKLFLYVVLPGVLYAQVETARIIGHVTDASGAVIPNVTLTVVNTATNISYVTKSQPDGSYTSIPLRVGSYRVVAEQTGFKRVVHDGIVLQIQQTALVDVVMEVGQVTQEVEVTGAAPLLTVNEATQGQVIDNRKVVDLPLNGRDYVQLGLLSSGTDQPAPGARTGGFSASGMRSTQNNYLLDGVDNNNSQIAYQGLQGESVKPNVDAIQEFKVMTNSFSAEYGRASGAIVNVTMKSGTNELHGTAFEFLRNEKLDARNFFDLPTNQKAPFKRNQYGFSAGGPIVKNKTFFFGDYEASRIRQSNTVNSTLPTPAMTSGDFSQILPTIIYDPGTYDAVNGVRQPFANNVIPKSRFDPTGTKVAAFYPTPNKPGLSNNYLSNPPANTDLDHFDVKVDHTFSEKDSVYTRFSYQKTVIPATNALPAPAFGSGSASSTTNTGNNYMLAYNHVFAPTFIASVKVAWNRLFTDIEPPQVLYNQQLGLKGVATDIPGMAQFTVSGYSSLGIGSTTPNLIGSQNRQLVADITWIHNKHTVKYGINLSFMQSTLTNPQDSQGIFAFNGAYTRDPKTARQGNPVADLLLGYPFQGQTSTWAHMNQRAPFYDFYAQDEWRVTTRLTLNFGLRYEMHLPWVEKYNNWTNFDIDTDPAHAALVPAKSGSRADRATIQPDLNDFAPRFGFAYRLAPKTVMRGGYGIYLTQYEAFGGAQYLEINPPFEYKAILSTNNINPTILLSQGLPPNLVTPQNASNIQTSSYDRNLRHGYAQQWSYSLQRELPGDMLLEIGYYANSAHKLMRRTEGNIAPAGPGDVNSRRRYRSVQVPNSIVVGPLAGTYRQEADSNSNFNSLQVKVEKRISHGLSVLGSYMFSKTISNGRGESGAGGVSNSLPQDPQNFTAERSLADEHRPHRFVSSYVYELPVGRGKTWLGGASRVVDGVVGGWTVAGILTLSSGQLASLTVLGNPSNNGVGADRPNVVHDWHLAGGQSLQKWFDTSAFAANPVYTFGNAGRNLIPGPRTSNLDFALYKNFRITERVRMQFRAEAFNSTNTPPFNPPTVQVGSPGFGIINTAGTPRDLQFGLKVLF